MAVAPGRLPVRTLLVVVTAETKGVTGYEPGFVARGVTASVTGAGGGVGVSLGLN